MVEGPQNSNGNPGVSRSRHQARITLSLLQEFLPLMRNDANLPQKIQFRLSRDKNFGSRDRRRYRELLYTAIRYLPWVEEKLKNSEEETMAMLAWLCADTPATHQFKEDIGPAPSEKAADNLTLAEKATILHVSTKALMPAWFDTLCPAAKDEIDILHSRAPLWIRVQTRNPKPLLEEFQAKGWPLHESRILPNAYEAPTDASVTSTESYQKGLFEVQDLGSQLIIGTLPQAKSGHWLDACAGAGGKTLQLAKLLFDTGHTDAYDIRPSILGELKLRAQRANINNINIRTQLTHKDQYDHILVDAPCTGLGTLRRSPHLKWLHTPETIAKAAELQKEILANAATHLKPGGTLTYATCSLARMENEDVIVAFLSAHPNYEILIPPHYILPSQHDTDGFFTATLKYPSA